MSRYAASHANPAGPGDARPTALQIIKDEGVEGKLTGKIIVMTGVSSGIGIETVRALSVTGATLYLVARDLTKAKAALVDIFNPDRMGLFQMDQESLESVRGASRAILSKTDKINILINNAGIMAVPDLRFTKDGYELQFGTNHLSHFLFFELLKPALLAGATPDFHSRVVSVASSVHQVHGINDSDNYNFQKGGYDPTIAYAQSKTANIYMANEIERRYGSRHLHATSLHPGTIAATGLTRFMDPEVVEGIVNSGLFRSLLKSGEQGAATTVWAAIGEEWATKGGKYLLDCTVAKPPSENESDIHAPIYALHAYDPERESRLWEDSLKLVGLEESE